MKTFGRAVAVLGIASLAWGGWDLTVTTKSDDGAGGRETVLTTVRGWVDGERARFEFKEAHQSMVKSGAFLITTDGGKTLYLVDPEEKTFMKWDMDQMMNMAGTVTRMMNLKVVSHQVEKVLEEKGEKICGFPTTHYRYNVSYNVEMSFMGMKQASSVSQVQDIWTTTEIPDQAMGTWLKKQDVKTGDEGVDQFIKAQTVTVKGFPLRQTTLQRTRDPQGKEQVTRTTMEVTELKKASIPAGLFKIPEGYKEASLAVHASGDEAQHGENSTPPLPFLKLFGPKKSSDRP